MASRTGSLSLRSRISVESLAPDALDGRMSTSEPLIRTRRQADHEAKFEPRLFAPSPVPVPVPGGGVGRGRGGGGKGRKKKEERRGHEKLLVAGAATSLLYRPLPTDGGPFRSVVLYAGSGEEPIRCRLLLSWVTWHASRLRHTCLSYCWESGGETGEQHAILVRTGENEPYHRFSVTENLFTAMKKVRNPRCSLLIWIDQICINQADMAERAQQVSIMGDIFSSALEVIVWLGDESDRSDRLLEYARRYSRGSRGGLERIMTVRQVHEALQRLLARPWFSRVWVIPEVVLARRVSVQVGRSQITWDSLVNLIRDMAPAPDPVGFDKQTCLLGNRRQRIALINQMAAERRTEGRRHSDITQLLMLAKASDATDVRDKIYAFLGFTYISTPQLPVSYGRPVEQLYRLMAEQYIDTLLSDGEYSSSRQAAVGADAVKSPRWTRNDDVTFQLMSMLYSAGLLQQTLPLPSWVPDWTTPWHLAPLWCRTAAHHYPAAASSPRGPGGHGRRKHINRLRADFRAGGDHLGSVALEMIVSPDKAWGLRLGAVVLDEIVSVTETMPSPSPSATGIPTATASASASASDPCSLAMRSPVTRYGRDFFETAQGYCGLTSPGTVPGDRVAILLGGDVPVVLRAVSGGGGDAGDEYRLVCDCLVHHAAVMDGRYLFGAYDQARDVLLL